MRDIDKDNIDKLTDKYVDQTNWMPPTMLSVILIIHESYALGKQASSAKPDSTPAAKAALYGQFDIKPCKRCNGAGWASLRCPACGSLPDEKKTL